MKPTSTIFAVVASAAVCLAGCDDSNSPAVNLGLEDSYRIQRMQKLILQPSLTGSGYRWQLDGKTVSTDREYIFLASREGTYQLALDITDPDTQCHHEMTVTVMHEESEYSPHIERVYEYRPAPGQFVNLLPEWEEGDDYADMLDKATESISGTNDVVITLGAYGGYVTFGFDHTVVNVDGEKDFKIRGNAFNSAPANGDESMRGGSSEPGIVMVSLDVNGNGIPDDPWYELAGSEHFNPGTKHGYTITYHAPDPDRTIISSGMITDAEYIGWTDSNGDRGFIARNTYHRQEYFPCWIDDTEMTFSGTCLPKNAVDLSGNGTNYFMSSFDWGYADNHPNSDDELISFDISWAVDSHGNSVKLPGADFVRVYTGVNQSCGWLGETSTEISGATDLHLLQ